MNRSKKLSPEVRERAVRMVLEHRGKHPSVWSAVDSIATKIGESSQVAYHQLSAGMLPIRKIRHGMTRRLARCRPCVRGRYPCPGEATWVRCRWAT
jgi:transposase-like protein